MTNKLSTQPYKGTRDFLPEEMSIRTQLFETLFQAVESFGFQRYDGPVLESAEIYEAKSGEEIANQQLYSLVDKGNRRLALRPEMTPSVARMIARSAGTLSFPARWYSHVNCHRYERPQRGRVREHWQLNVDMFGSESAEAEVEIFDLIHALLGAMGASDDQYVLRVNDRILVEAALTNHVGVPEEKRTDVGMIIDRWEKVNEAARAKAMAELGLDGAPFERLCELVNMDLDAYCQAAGPEAVERSRIVAIIREKQSQAPIQFDPMIMRAFNYYTSTVFEVFDTDPKNRRSIFGGGRYDDLASLFTKQKIPGIGFGMGDVTTWNFMESHGLLPKPDTGAQVYLFSTEAEGQAMVRQAARTFRQAGYRTSTAMGPTRMRNGLKQANRMGVIFAGIIGTSEIENNSLTIKNMKLGDQDIVDQETLLDHLKSFMIQPVKYR
ncbi:MAG: histidine--tRNA ligase [Magnetococcales bacterium]|nr:histidine--tRNA ligase [Magnetococcales bacterium]